MTLRGEEMTTVIKYSKRKTVGLRVRDGRLFVTAPIGTSREHIDALLKKHSRWIEGALLRDAARQRMAKSLIGTDKDMLKRQALEYFRPICERYARALGVRYSKLSISEAKCRFGSCSSNGSIRLSVRLMAYPEVAREYVALHEICHLVHMNHSRAFYSLIERHMPDYKVRMAALKMK